MKDWYLDLWVPYSRRHARYLNWPASTETQQYRWCVGWFRMLNPRNMLSMAACEIGYGRWTGFVN